MDERLGRQRAAVSRGATTAETQVHRRQIGELGTVEIQPLQREVHVGQGGPDP